MAYVRTVWINDNAPALNATNLNKIEQGIYDNAENIDDLLAVTFEAGAETAGSVTWHYKKFANGTFEMWGEVTTTLTIGTAAGSIYTTANEYDVALPTWVSEVNFITGEVTGGGWVDITAFGATPKMRMYAPTSYSSASRYIRYFAIGTWSE